MRLAIATVAIVLLGITVSPAASQTTRNEGFVVQLAHSFNPGATTTSLTRLEAAGFKDIRVFRAKTDKGPVYRIVTHSVPDMKEARLLATESKRIAKTKKLRVEATILSVKDIGQPFVK